MVLAYEPWALGRYVCTLFAVVLVGCGSADPESDTAPRN